MTTPKTPSEIWLGQPISVEHNPDPSLIIEWALYVQGLVEAGINILEPADLATTAPITLSGEQTIDGTLTSGSRVLVKDHADAWRLGVWVTGAGAWTRASDADTAAKLTGALVPVLGGVANGGTGWRIGKVSTIGVDPVLIAPVDSVAAVAAHAARGDNPHSTTKDQVGLANVNNTSDADKPVSTAQQAALDGKADVAHTQTASTISDSTAAGRVILTAADAAAQRAALVLGNVDNTPDSGKPVSMAQQAALDEKTDLAEAEDLVRSAAASQPASAAGIIPILGDAAGLAVDYIEAPTGIRRIAALKERGWRPQTVGGIAPVVIGEDGSPVIGFDPLDRVLRADAPIVGRERAHAVSGMEATELRGGQPVAGWRGGEYVRLHPLHAAQRLALMSDTHGIQQLFLIAENENLGTDWARQITYATKDVTGWRWVKLPTAHAPGLVQIDRADQPFTKFRHVGGRAEVHCSPPVSDEPAAMTYVVVLGQSNSVGAGALGVTAGAQSVYDLMLRPRETWSARLLRWNGGVMPHQVGVASEDRDTAISGAQISSFQALREGDNDNGEDRETFATALALHLNGPNGYDAGRYVLTGSFGFGGSSFTELILDGGAVQTSYQNALDSITAAQALCDAASVSLEVIVVYDQGEADASTGATTYRDFLTGWHADLVTRVGAITGQSDVKLFLSQTIWTKGTADAPCDSAVGQALAADAVSDIHLLPPSYFTYPDTDPIHHKATEHQWRGALYGEAIADVMMGRGDPGLRLAAAAYTGDEMTVTFNHDITLDRETIVALGNEQGLSHSNSNGATQAISYVIPAGADTLLMQLADPVPVDAVETVLIASEYATDTSPGGSFGYEAGLRSSVRRSDWVRYSMIDGRPLFIFANIDQIAATEA